MRLQRLLLPALAATAVSCSSPPAPPPVAVDPPGTPAATPEAEVERLRAENAKLRAQLTGVSKEAAVNRDKVAVIEAKQKTIEAGKLEPGMTVQDANRAINGSPNLNTDTCQLVQETDAEWTYRILSGAQTGGPGSGGAASIGTNMRGDRVVPVQAWICTFDRRTGKLTNFRRDLGQ